jgi:serine/threonine protein kinase/tetratricopeptide (TPR) repeat protein
MAHAHGERAPENFADRLRERYGDGVDPEVSIGGDTPQSLGPATSELLKRLADQGVRSPRYKVEGEVARGGMGAILRVWDADLRRHLAMKVALAKGDAPSSGPTPRLDTRLLSRFLEEAQVTGQLDHPGIVPVHELGLDQDGRVYFTMKLVQGRDLKAIFDLVFAAKEGWNETRALGVILKACEAMGYAHAKGVIHRDLKPANVMVGNFGEVYVMDWGVARVSSRKDERDLRVAPIASARPASVRTERRLEREELSDSPIVTMDGDVVGTPAYMPPEQARGEIQSLSSRSDVYSIGALLYHLLARTPPYGEASGARVSNRTVLARVLEGPPRRLREIRAEVPAELIAICEKAMARDANARYADTLALAEDLRAYLEHRVVRAHRTGAWAEAAKWIERNRALAASLAAGVVVLLAGVVVVAAKNVELSRANTTIQSQVVSLDAEKREAEASRQTAETRRQEAEVEKARAVAEKAQADKNAEETRVVADFQSDILAGLSVETFGRSLISELRGDLGENLARRGASPGDVDAALARFDADVSPANPTNVAQRVLGAQVFQPAVEKAESNYKDRPLLAAMLQTPLSVTLHKLGLYDLGARAAASAVEARRKELGSGNIETLASINDLALLLQSQGKLAEAEPLYREALAGYRAQLGDSNPETLTVIDNLALVSYARGKLPDAEALLREALAGRRTTLGDADPVTLGSVNNLASVLQDQGKLAEAEPLYREALAGCRAKLGDRHPDTLTGMDNLASLLQAQGKYAEAEPLFREALAGRRATLGDDHPRTLSSINNLAFLLKDLGRLDESERLYREALAGQRSKLGEDHPDTLSTMINLGGLLVAERRLPDAEAICRDALAGCRRKLGDEHPQTLAALNEMATVLQRERKLDEAEPLFRELVAGCRKTLGEEHPHTLVSLNNLALFLLDRGKPSEAEPLLRKALAGSRTQLGDEHPGTLTSIDNLARALRAEGKSAEAEPLYREALAGRRKKLGDANVDTLKSEIGLGLTLQALGEFPEAEVLLKETVRQAPQAKAESGILLEAETTLRDLYRAWHAAEPKAGHDRQAEEIDARIGGK